MIIPIAMVYSCQVQCAVVLKLNKGKCSEITVKYLN
jgi:hypothetical protein